MINVLPERARALRASSSSPSSPNFILDLGKTHKHNPSPSEKQTGTTQQAGACWTSPFDFCGTLGGFLAAPLTLCLTPSALLLHLFI
ncbi:hypothetical protein FKM82_009135 [Ascaphus truei]